MFKLRDVLIFIAGAVFFHGLSHIILPYYISLPWDVGSMVITSGINTTIIIVSFVVALLLLWGAKKLSR